MYTYLPEKINKLMQKGTVCAQTEHPAYVIRYMYCLGHNNFSWDVSPFFSKNRNCKALWRSTESK